MDRLVREGELDASFKQIEKSGGQPYDFDCAYCPDSLGEEEIVELTYLPTGQTRWYDAAKQQWASDAVDDFKGGRFATAS